MKISVVSGGFDPIHSGHIAYFKAAKELSDKLIVSLNSDEWLNNKKGKFFMPFQERKNIIENFTIVDEVIDFEDDEKGSATNALIKIKKLYPGDEIIFCNGGDRNENNITEMKVEGVKFKFGVGGEKKANSSSWILKNWKYEEEDRVWGKFYNLFSDDGVKVKELIINPGKGMSYQRHFHRSEIWFVFKGSCSVKTSKKNPDKFKVSQLKKEDYFLIKKNEWHQIFNETKDPCHIIEIQFGDKTDENDIERLYFYENE